jgi:hypothetical protein
LDFLTQPKLQKVVRGSARVAFLSGAMWARRLNGVSSSVLTAFVVTDTRRELNMSKHQVGGDHYINLAVQPWDAMRSWMTDEQFQGFLRGNVIKYVSRAQNLDKSGKGGVEDLRKARHYIDELIELVDGDIE